MGPFVALFWPEQDGAGERAATIAGAALGRSEGWRLQAARPGVQIYGRSDRPVGLRSSEGDRALVLGHLFDAAGQPAPVQLGGLTATPAPAAQTLLTTYWGRYVAVFTDAEGVVRGVLRDPSGAVDCLVWRRDGVTVVASALPPALMAKLGPGRGLDWAAVHRLTADPLFGSVDALVEGVTAVAPGALALAVGDAFLATQMWRPAVLARDAVTDVEFAASALRDRIDTCVAAHAAGAGPILAEVSGGLDSSIVAGALVHAQAEVACWCNHVTPDPSGDERVFARILGRHLGFEVLERLRAPFAVEPDGVALSQFGPRPSANALDLLYDRDMLALAGRCGAKAVFTGLGGDGLFFLSAFPPIARDLLLRRGARAMFTEAFGALARRCRRSVWSMARQALWPQPQRFAITTPAWIAPLVRNGAALHPWLVDTADLPPAKRRHVEEQVYAQLFGGASLRGEAVDLVHPLVSQPILELCLRIPVDIHAAGGRDRDVARRAFADRLPAAIIERRSKGELGAYYSDAIAAGLPAIRAYLLEGMLCARGILIRSALEPMLEESSLAEHGGFSMILRVLAVEAWVRRWSGML